MPYRTVFDVVWSGRRHVMMMASQIDRTGNQNISGRRRLGPAQGRSWSGCAARRATRSTTRPATGCPTTPPAPFVEHVDVVSGVGYARAAAAGPGATRYHRSARGGLQPRRVRLRNPRAGHAPALGPPRGVLDEVRAATGFELAVADDVARDPPARPPTSSPPLREVLDPRGPGTGRSKAERAPGRHPAAAPRPHPALRTRFCELTGVALPDRPDRHGLGGRPPAGGGHRRRPGGSASWPRPP